MRHKLSVALLAGISLVLFTGTLAGCAPKLGDGCKTSTDCSIRGDRICDRAQPGGYCTIAACKPGDCGDEGICVRFRPDEPRLSATYCMAKCESTGDCDRDRYVCRAADDLKSTNDEGAVAEVLEGPLDAKFCVVKE